MIRQILLSLPTHPDRPPQQTLESAAFLAQALGASLTAHIPQLCADPQTWPAIIGTFPLDFPQMMNEAVAQSESNAASLADDIARICAQWKVPLDMRRVFSTLLASAEPLVDLGRLHDLVILPLPETDAFGRHYLEAAIFGTARPSLLLPSVEGGKRLQSLKRILVAWDYSREAARALADALPLLSRAESVRILSIFGEKGIHTSCVAGDLEKYLATHQVKYSINHVTMKEGGIGDCVMSQAEDADLLVMGAYGHSRLREFILGGATQAILAGARLPVFLSH
jgi:nucleotide-binding universal stress UspA family protein